MRHTANILIGLVLTTSFAFSQDMFDDLNKAFRKESVELTNEFFKSWELKSIPFDKGKLNDTLLMTYELFDSFLKPDELSKLGANPDFDTVYSDSKYLIVSNQINIYIKENVYRPANYIDSIKRSEAKRFLRADSTDNKKVQSILDTFFPVDYGYEPYGKVGATLIDSLVDFRPYTSIPDKQLLFFKNDYKLALQQFLGEDIYDRYKNPRQLSRTHRQIQKRLDFLKPFVTIRKGWHFDFHILSYPEPISIVFDKDFKYARIDYWINEKTGFAIFERNNDEWALKFGILTRTI